ncbi:FtsK/SpoIIIE domain-containing protein [Dactylosporangium salmoneum]|uniref:FtsK domain-containing protein n=1 Tax=Dactylosporangium salmoneum TaxID=53361 RepID=A0ABN3FQ61_9ACTN
MRIRVTAAYDDHELRVVPSATVDEVRRRLYQSQGPLIIDGVGLAADTPIADAVVLDGAVVVTEGDGRPATGAGWLLATATGPDGGRGAGLADGRHQLEPGLMLSVDGPAVTAAVGADGAVIDGRLCHADGPVAPGVVLGSAPALARLARIEAAEPGMTGAAEPGRTRVPFHRAPRGPLPAPAPLPEEPREAEAAGRSAGFLLTSVFAPLVFALGIYLISRQLAYALLSLLAVPLALGGLVEHRLRGRRERRRNHAAYERDLAKHAEAMAEAAADEVHRRWAGVLTPAECERVATLPGRRLWQRTAGDPDFGHAAAAVGTVRWGGPGELTPVPLPSPLGPHETVSLTGPPDLVDALARALLCQLAVHQGPADLRIALLLDNDLTRWDWAKWLPHLRTDDDGAMRCAACADERQLEAAVQRLLAEDHRRAAGAPAPQWLFVVSGERLRPGACAALRRAVADGAALLVVGGPAPDIATTRLEVEAGGTLRHTAVRDGVTIHGAAPMPMAMPSARRFARALARYEDPLIADRQPALPEIVRLSALGEIGLAAPVEQIAAEVERRWKAGTARDGLAAAIGMTEHGVFELDLVRQGPHCLIGGTTSSGKSELLKTIVAALALRYSPEQVVFGLFDFKGKTSLQELARLPHVVGLVGDTDLHEAERALRYLAAELLRREQLLFAAQVEDIAQYPGGLPRLVVVIDEFQILADELPNLLGKIIDVIKRGRSLGVHLLFATQSPMSIRNYDEIKRNTRLRITLRLEDEEDSRRLVDLPDAALIRRPGQGIARLGAGRVERFQTGYVSGLPVPTVAETLDVLPFRLTPAWREDEPPGPPAPSPVTPEPPAPPEPDPVRWWERLPGTVVEPAWRAAEDVHKGQWWQDAAPGADAAASASEQIAATGPGAATELVALIDGVLATHGARAGAEPYEVWPPALPERLAPDRIPPSPRPGDPHVTFALGDDPEGPDHAKQPAIGWDLHAGNLLVFGVPGSGTSTALRSLALALAAAYGPDELRLFALDLGGGALQPLAALPHCAGNHIVTGDTERQAALIAHLGTEIDRRCAQPPEQTRHEPWLVLLVDHLPAFLAEHSAAHNRHSAPLVDGFLKVFAQGGATRVVVAGTAAGGRVPTEVTARVRQRLVLKLADAGAYLEFGIRPGETPRAVPGRGVWLDGEARIEAQVAIHDDVAAAVRAVSTGRRAAGAAVIRPLPEAVDEADLRGAVRWDGGTVLSMPVGIGGVMPGPVVVALEEGAPLLVYGPTRSRKSTLLARIARLARDAGEGPAVYLFAPEGSPLHGCDAERPPARDEAEAAALAARIEQERRPVLLVIDDLAAAGDAFAGLLHRGRPGAALLIVAADRLDRLRGAAFGSFAYQLRNQSGHKITLQPDVSAGDPITGRNLTYFPSRPAPGRGFLLGPEQTQLIQT